MKIGWDTKWNQTESTTCNSVTDKKIVPNSIEQSYNALQVLIDLSTNDESEIQTHDDNNDEYVSCNIKKV